MGDVVWCAMRSAAGGYGLPILPHDMEHKKVVEFPSQTDGSLGARGAMFHGMGWWRL